MKIKKLKNNKKSLSKRGENNPNWKGDNVGLEALHNWVHSRLKKPNACQECKKNKPYDLANISNKYLRDLTDWEWLCRRCHMKKDGRLKKFIRCNNKLTPKSVLKIYKLKGKVGSLEISKKYKISRDHIRSIWCGQRWGKITEHSVVVNENDEEIK